MSKKAFREAKVGILNRIPDRARADAQSFAFNLPDGIETETLFSGYRRNFGNSGIQAISATEIKADGHIPHTDGFYQNIKKRTSSHFTEIPGKVNQDREGKAPLFKTREAKSERRNVTGICIRALSRSGRTRKGHDAGNKIKHSRRVDDRRKKRLVTEMRPVKAADRQRGAQAVAAERRDFVIVPTRNESVP